MNKEGNKILSSDGQTLVEYLLLTMVIVVLITGFFRSDIFAEYINPYEGKVFKALTSRLKYSYRHAISGKDEEQYPPNYNSSDHKSYIQPNGQTRFFGPAERYPENQ